MLLINTCRRCFMNQQQKQFARLSMVTKYDGFRRFLSGLDTTNPKYQRQNIDFRKSRIKTKIIESTDKKVGFFNLHLALILKISNVAIFGKNKM